MCSQIKYKIRYYLCILFITYDYSCYTFDVCYIIILNHHYYALAVQRLLENVGRIRNGLERIFIEKKPKK